MDHSHAHRGRENDLHLEHEFATVRQKSGREVFGANLVAFPAQADPARGACRHGDALVILYRQFMPDTLRTRTAPLLFIPGEILPFTRSKSDLNVRTFAALRVQDKLHRLRAAAGKPEVVVMFHLPFDFAEPGNTIGKLKRAWTGRALRAVAATAVQLDQGDDKYDPNKDNGQEDNLFRGQEFHGNHHLTTSPPHPPRCFGESVAPRRGRLA